MCLKTKFTFFSPNRIEDTFRGRTKGISNSQFYSILTQEVPNCEESIDNYSRTVLEQVSNVLDRDLNLNVSRMVTDTLEANCLRTTKLKSAFTDIDKFYVLDSQESSSIASFLTSAPTNIDCRQAFAVEKVTKIKVVQLLDAMKNTEQIVDRMSQILRAERNTIILKTLSQPEDVIVDNLSKKLFSAFVDRLQKNQLLSCTDENKLNDDSRTTLKPRELFSTFSNSILTPTTSLPTHNTDRSMETQTFIVVSSENDGTRAPKSVNSTEMKTSISVVDNVEKSTDTQTSIFVGPDSNLSDSNLMSVFNSNSPVLVGQNEKKLLPGNQSTTTTPAPETISTTILDLITKTSSTPLSTIEDSTTKSSTTSISTTLDERTATIPSTLTTSTLSTTGTTLDDSTTTTPSPSTTEQSTTGFPVTMQGISMTPRSTRPTGTTPTTTAPITTTITSGRINPNLLNLLGRG